MSVFTFCSAKIIRAVNSEVTMNGCGADRMWQDGIVAELAYSDLKMINQLKYNCMMFEIDLASKISIFGRMNLVLGNSPAINDVEYNLINNVTIKDTYPKLINEKVVVHYNDDVAWNDKPSVKNPLNDIIDSLR